MEFVVEDGSGLPNSISYITEDYLFEFAIATGTPIGSGDPKAAATSATMWLDGTYGARYPGTRKNGRGQGLGWPRTGATDAYGFTVPDDEVPVEIMRATAAAGLREMTTPGSLTPDPDPGGAVKMTRKKLGPMETETQYTEGSSGGGATGSTSYADVDGYLSGLLLPSSGGDGSSSMIELVRA